ncbi:CIC11C00000005176 [Sungouiella intermedia]|uniref:CIC11C00000005176 n=1 Tax=Sungouiella intermedia TaxID=45354 RepID=A0A1L0BYT2_9ASCO|nr:CIC11C00000005176 [[Candida] intermedia]
MAKLVVPPADSRLVAILNQVLDQKVLHNDALWTLECLPLLFSRLDVLHSLVREAQVANANTPDSRIVNHIFHTLTKIRGHLEDHFREGAPFTVHRLSELIVDHDGSGYLLTTVVLAQKYVLALARTVMVLSKESDFRSIELGNRAEGVRPERAGAKEHEKTGNGLLSSEYIVKIAGNGSSALVTDDSTTKYNQTNMHPRDSTPVASAQDYEEFDLPTNIRFVTLPWAETTEKTESETTNETSVSVSVQDFDLDNSVSGVEDVETDIPDGVKEAKTPPSKRLRMSKSNSVSPEKQLFQLLSPLHMDGKIEESECAQLYFEEKLLDYKVDRTERYSEEVLF